MSFFPDINECLIPGTCSQRCVNRPGGFKCACLKGYLNDPRDRTRCRASEGHASLLFAHKSDIRSGVGPIPNSNYCTQNLTPSINVMKYLQQCLKKFLLSSVN